eukprot:TRINITY_DN963_c0_g1_i1.p1 TRINITY_DN963_c0_g1~~TRINITY_DN963_c0_g1_i1.p1  ORF type:complete len:162 (-),score=20.34 TRINITY_DN963_c0_g1_i1:378-863(-)
MLCVCASVRPFCFAFSRRSFLSATSSSALASGLRLNFRNKPSTLITRSQSRSMAETVPSIVVYVTVPNKEEGKKLAQSIVSEKLAACVNQVPGVESTYMWKDKIEIDSEVLLVIKTRASLLDSLTAHVKTNHPYDVPEVISLPITGGNQDYLKWLKENTRD